MLESFSSLGSRFLVKTDNVATNNFLILTEEKREKFSLNGRTAGYPNFLLYDSDEQPEEARISFYGVVSQSLMVVFYIDH